MGNTFLTSPTVASAETLVTSSRRYPTQISPATPQRLISVDWSKGDHDLVIRVTDSLAPLLTRSVKFGVTRFEKGYLSA